MKGTIKSKEKINLLFSHGSKFYGAGFIAFFCACSRREEAGKSAFAAGKKLGSAPVRSRAKRRLRAAAEEAGAPWHGFEVMFVARNTIKTVEFKNIVKDMKRLGAQLQQKDLIAATPIQESAEAPDTTPLASESGVEGSHQEIPHSSSTPTAASKVGAFIVGIPRNIALLCISVYRHAISPFFPPSCRYVPTCSEYAMIAFERFGFWRGLLLSVKRVGRCHPFAEGGYDPVPEILSKKLA